mmetsp:Transcript_28464/g.48409  ORF Transcript_28464/g.48409 Transcript_28464/m.48409 type:complete len:224 (+) Transcript_28464:690-1361(+)
MQIEVEGAVVQHGVEQPYQLPTVFRPLQIAFGHEAVGDEAGEEGDQFLYSGVGAYSAQRRGEGCGVGGGGGVFDDGGDARVVELEFFREETVLQFADADGGIFRGVLFVGRGRSCGETAECGGIVVVEFQRGSHIPRSQIIGRRRRRPSSSCSTRAVPNLVHGNHGHVPIDRQPVQRHPHLGGGLHGQFGGEVGVQVDARDHGRGEEGWHGRFSVVGVLEETV